MITLDRVRLLVPEKKVTEVDENAFYTFTNKVTVKKEILNNIENLYHYSNNREVAKIQDEFYRIYESKDLARLERFHQELDVIAEGYRAQAVATEEIL